MPNDDTIKLLKECDAGTKMAIKSINEVVSRAKDQELTSLLQYFLKEHEILERKCDKKLHEFQDQEKEPNAMAEMMSWLKTEIKLLPGPTDQEIADLMIDGCNMGIKSVSRYINQYPTAIHEVQEIADEIIRLEQRFMDALRKYL